MTTINYADVQVGDEIEIATTTRERKIVAYKSATWIGVDFEGGGGVPFRSTEGKERVFTLISRPVPPKPAAKVGDKLTRAVVEPPLGAVARRVTSGWGGAAAIGNLRVRTEDGWLLVKGGTPTTDKLLEYNRLDSNGYVLASLPE